ncbi:universal stress protein [Micromonospora purpureochromogenes]|uniref:universal stress protein n=1 Tax=Micromonospora purpureochromogenes TaxID=47872 RepID=UPI0033254838
MSTAAAALARCPVVVVPDDDRVQTPDASIVVGVDESPEAQLAIGFAFEEAAIRSVGLTAVRVWTPPLPGWWGDVDQHILHTAERATAERNVLQSALHGWADKYPGVAVRTGLTAGDTGPALALLARYAQLVVVGVHRTSRLHRQPGSVSRHLLRYAACPVALVRELSVLNAMPTVR